MEEKEEVNKSVDRFGFNEFISNKISLTRNIKDVRDVRCKKKDYSSLSDYKVSIIICFYNEAWSTLLRTIHSLLSRSPENLLNEIILIDDFSDMPHLQNDLNRYIKKLKKVSLHRNPSRQGVVKSKIKGVSLSSSPILLFIDSHVEVTKGWLEPLVQVLHDNPKSIATPVMDIIDDKTFKYNNFNYDSINIGSFSWTLEFSWVSVPERVKNTLKDNTDAIDSAIFSGGCFALKKKRYFELGGFDEQMDGWGSENLEFSFKSWMCGGNVKTSPCSHVGHVFKSGVISNSFDSSNRKKNQQRVAEIWLDDYKKFYYKKSKSVLGEIGDVSKRNQLRKDLGCQSFQWFVDNVVPEIFIPDFALKKGEIRNSKKGFGDGNYFEACLDSADKHLRIFPCHGLGGNQFWMLSKFGEVRNDEDCFDFAGEEITLYPCHGQKGNQEWQYSNQKLIHKGTQLCLSLLADYKTLSMEHCQSEKNQIWLWNEIETVKKSSNNKQKVVDNLYEDEEYEDEETEQEGKDENKNNDNDKNEKNQDGFEKDEKKNNEKNDNAQDNIKDGKKNKTKDYGEDEYEDYKDDENVE